MKRFGFFVLVISIFSMFSLPVSSFAQDIESLANEAKLLERKYKDEEAIEKYAEILVLQPTNMLALVKTAELWGNIGRRAEKLYDRNVSLKQSNIFSDKALQADSNDVMAIWVKGLVHKNFAETEEKRDLATENLRLWKVYAEKALEIDRNHALSMHLLAQWHLEVLTQGGLRKASAKILYGGLKDGNIETAIRLMEACRELEPYYAANFLDLARAYDYKKDYANAIQTLERLAKLPIRRLDDKTIKAAGNELMQKLQ